MTGDEKFTFDDASQPNAALLFVVRKRHEHAILIIDAYAPLPVFWRRCEDSVILSAFMSDRQSSF